MIGDSHQEPSGNRGAVMSTTKILTGNSHPKLAELVANRLGTDLVKCKVGKFANQETRCDGLRSPTCLLYEYLPLRWFLIFAEQSSHAYYTRANQCIYTNAHSYTFAGPQNFTHALTHAYTHPSALTYIPTHTYVCTRNTTDAYTAHDMLMHTFTLKVLRIYQRLNANIARKYTLRM